MHTIEYVNTTEKLESLCHKVGEAQWVAIDTEFLREKTYYPKFCLLQLATLDWVACVDPLLLPDLDSLFKLLANPELTKVFHACRQDMEIFYHLNGCVLSPIFDTQIAAPLLGMQENPGYAMLVSNFLNINLRKSQTRTDWSKRPLTEEQLQYAAEDVIYLGQIYQIISKKLQELGRLSWLQHDFQHLLQVSLYQMPPEHAWMRIKGKNKLTGKQLSILQALAQWREQMAQNNDKPRNWLLRDEVLLDLVRLQPQTKADLAKLRSLNERTINRYGDQLCAIFAEAATKAPIKLDDKIRPAKKTPHQEAVLDVLSALVRIRAEENSLNPAILASRKDLEMLLFSQPGCALLKGWRYSMVGEELQHYLDQGCALTIQSGLVKFAPLIPAV